MDIIKDVNLAINGDEKAMERLYYNTYPKLRAVTMSILKKESDVEDIIQDTYIKAFSSLNQLDNPNKFEAWLCRIASNKCKDYLKKHKPMLFSEFDNEEDDEPFEWSIKDDGSDYNPEEVTISEDTRSQLIELLNTLPDEQRICLVYYAVDEMKISEIAELLEVSENTVKSRLRYAEMKMKDKIETLEKQGVKIRSLSGFALFPFLRYLFSAKAEASSMPPVPSNIISESVKETVKNVVADNVGSVVTGTAVQTAKTITGHAIKYLWLKIVAGMVAVATIATVIAGIINNPKDISNKNNDSSMELSFDNHVDKAFELYEELLTKGITDSGLEITHYAYIYLGDDDIPELLVSNGSGTIDAMSECQLFTYAENQIRYCNSSGAYYDYFYLVNKNEFVRGCSRKGNQFISIDKKIELTTSIWSEDLGKSFPAIAYNDGVYEEVSDEELDYYHLMPDSGESNRFMQTAEIIYLNENSFVKSQKIDMMDNIAKNEIVKLNEYITSIAKFQSFEYPCSARRIYDFAFLYSKFNLNTLNTNADSKRYFEYSDTLAQSDIDSLTVNLFGKTFSIEPFQEEHCVYDGETYCHEAADGETHPYVALTEAVYNNGDGTYSVIFNIFEEVFI